MELTVIVPTHNPDLRRFRATLDGLRGQTLDSARWQTLVIDNASATFPTETDFTNVRPQNFRVLREPTLGLTAARLRGFREAQTPFIVLVDDDNVLAPDYLEQVLAIFAAHPRVALVGGKSLPEFETEPPAWAHEFSPLLALRDLGDKPLLSHGLRPHNESHNQYPAFAPIGAGLAIRASALQHYLTESAAHALTDRRGSELSSGGDNDIVLTLMRHGWEVGYFPALTLRHLIPASRTTRDYLARLNRGIAKSWVQVLAKHDANPWPAIARWTVPLRQLKAFFTQQAWRDPAAHIRWQGACGHFEGRATIAHSHG